MKKIKNLKLKKYFPCISPIYNIKNQNLLKIINSNTINKKYLIK